MNAWKKRERELNAKALAAKRGRLVHALLVPKVVKDKEGKEQVVLIGNTYVKEKK